MLSPDEVNKVGKDYLRDHEKLEPVKVVSFKVISVGGLAVHEVEIMVRTGSVRHADPSDKKEIDFVGVDQYTIYVVQVSAKDSMVVGCWEKREDAKTYIPPVIDIPPEIDVHVHGEDLPPKTYEEWLERMVKGDTRWDYPLQL